jgi:membrane-associated protein
MVDFLKFLINYILHIDVKLADLVCDYHTWIYLILFIVIFCETGLVITPFLPGDSLLFAAGSIAALGSQKCPDVGISIIALVLIFLSAAILGDNTNYFIGRFLGNKVYEKNYKYIRRDYLDKTHKFYEKHGGKTLVIARFMPIFRTFAPFVAGVGTMRYAMFISYCLIGNFLWVFTFSLGGYYFAHNSFVQHNFSIVILGIILVSFIPPFITFIKHWLEARKSKKAPEL